MFYFNSFPKIITTDYNNNGIVLTNIIKRVNIIPSLLKNPLLIYKYDLQEGDTPDIVANKYYGDSGAMLLGLLLASSAITLTGQIDLNAISQSSSRSTFLPLLLPFTILAIPLIDLGMAIVRRLRAGRSPFAADREHLHHRLLSMGNSHRRTTFILYIWTAMFAIPTVIAAFAPLWIAAVVAVSMLAVSLAMMGLTRSQTSQELVDVQ